MRKNHRSQKKFYKKARFSSGSLSRKRTKLSKRLWYLGIVIPLYLVFGYMILKGTENDIINMTTLKNQGVEITGAVTDKSIYRDPRNNHPTYYLHGNYTPEEGEIYSFSVNASKSAYENTAIGEGVELLYNPNEPQQSESKFIVMNYDASEQRLATYIILILVAAAALYIYTSIRKKI